MEVNEDILWREYFIDGTDVLKNNLGLINKEELEQAEKDVSFENLIELQLNPIKGTFDIEHLCLIHRYLFQDVYPFAGQFRTINMRKKTFFTAPQDIEKELKIVFEEMWRDFEGAKTKEEYAIFLAYTFSAIMKVHPFREGNGRTIREFVREFVYENIPEYVLKWSLVNKANLDLGIEYASFTKTYLINEFLSSLVPREREEDIKNSLN